MLEWRRVEDEADLPALLDPPPPPRRAARWMALLLLLPLLLGGTIVQRQASRQRAAMRADLLAMVQREEQARAFGMEEAIDELLVSEGLSDAWRSDYARAFRRPAPPPDEVVLLDVEEVADGVLATVSVDGREQVRHYRLEAGRWRRAPLPSALWGPTRLLEPDGAPAVAFAARDAAFATTLAADLPDLVRLATRLEASESFGRVQVRPIEHASRATARQSGDLTVVSPALFLSDDGWSGEESVRLQIAARILSDQSARVAASQGPPFAGRFAVAAVEVLRQRWALSPASYDRAVRTWAESAAPLWHSPFTEGDAGAVLSARLVAAYLLESEGEAALLAILDHLPQAYDWDPMLLRIVGMSAYHLEQEASVFRAGDLMALERLQSARPEAAPPPLPLRATELTTREPNLLTARLDGVAGLLQIETQRAALRLPDGETLPASCAALWPEVSVGGDWLRSGRRVDATALHAPTQAPPAPMLSPGNEKAPLGLRYNFENDEATPGWELVALAGTGTTVRLAGRLPGPAPVQVQGSPDGALLFRAATRYCEFAWYYRVVPSSGQVEQWRVRWPAGESFDWLTTMPGQEDLLALWIPPDGRPQAVAHLAGEGPAQIDARAVMEQVEGVEPIGWSAPDGRLVVRLAASGHFWLLDLESDSLERAAAIPTPHYPVQATVVDQGRRLLVTSTDRDGRDYLPRRLWRYDLATREQVALYQSLPDEEIVTSLGLAAGEDGDTRLLLLLRNILDGRLRLVLLLWDRPGWVREIDRYPPETTLSSMLLCSDERLLLSFFESPDSRDPALVSTTVLSWQPEGVRKVLYEGHGPLFLWGCG